MWKKKEKEKEISIEQLIRSFVTRNYHGSMERTTIKVGNVVFKIERTYGGLSYDIHLSDGLDSLHVYTGKIGADYKSEWLRKGAWCAEIQKILLDDQSNHEAREEARVKAKEAEENRILNKFESLFSGESNG
ncbi:hypothetical protein AAXB25_14350 [Paenibacillus lautus]|uniref:hypothetical protein n=1 Tax=Paenibacillus lautus TaxID=1401 RepID=UPI003D279B1B